MLVFGLFLLPCLKVVSADSHSLITLETYISGQTPFPEFSIVVMLDDVQIFYYDSVTWKIIYCSNSESKYFEEEQRDVDYVFRIEYDDLKYLDSHYKDHLNLTGVHVTQRLAGCDLLNNDKPGPSYFWDAFDGKHLGEYTFDKEKEEIQNNLVWTTWDKARELQEKLLQQHVYHPICIKTLRRYLNMEKNNVMRKVKPRVRLLRKMLPDSQGLQISCLATGFYPRHINLTLFRDDQPVDDDQMTGGEILPNTDGTYQMRKSLVFSEEELRKKHKYNCTMKHLNLDNKLDITFDVVESDPGSLSVFAVIVVLLVFMCVPVFIITALIIRRKRQAAAKGQGSETKQSDYSRTSSSDPDGSETSQDSIYKT